MDKNYVYFLIAGKSFSAFGTLLTTFTIFILLYNLSNLPAIIGLGGIVLSIPSMILGGVLGTFVDKYGPKKMLIISSISNLLIAGVLIILYEFWIVLLVCLFIYSTFLVLSGISFNALLPKLIGEEELFHYNSVISLSFMMAGFPAPVIAGYLLNINVPLIFLVDVITYAFELMVVLRLPLISSHIPKTSFLTDFHEGMKYIIRKKEILFVIAMIFIAFLFLGGTRTILIPYFSDLFGDNYSLFYGGFKSLDGISSGIILLAFSLGYIKIKKHLFATSFGIILFFIALLTLSAFPCLPVIIFSAILSGTSSGMISPNSMTYIQKTADSKFLGRVIGIQQVILSTSTLISYILLGALATIYSRRIMLSWIGIMGLLIMSIFAIFSLRMENNLSHKSEKN